MMRVWLVTPLLIQFCGCCTRARSHPNDGRVPYVAGRIEIRKEDGQIIARQDQGPDQVSFLIESRQPRYLSLHGEAADSVAQLHFVGMMSCSNHDPAHVTDSLDEMKELSKDPPACTGWKFVGAITNHPKIDSETERSFAKLDRSVFYRQRAKEVSHVVTHEVTTVKERSRP